MWFSVPYGIPLFFINFPVFPLFLLIFSFAVFFVEGMSPFQLILRQEEKRKDGRKDDVKGRRKGRSREK